jgi:hypothetical protein
VQRQRQARRRAPGAPGALGITASQLAIGWVRGKQPRLVPPPKCARSRSPTRRSARAAHAEQLAEVEAIVPRAARCRDLLPDADDGDAGQRESLVVAARRTFVARWVMGWAQLTSDDERVEWLARRLDQQLDHPLIAPGSGALAREMLARLPADPCLVFAQKLLLTLRDGEMHSTAAITVDEGPIGVSFVAWCGTWEDLIGKRYGLYLTSFFDTMKRLASRLGSLAALLQIDAFVDERDEPALDVEYTYFPGALCGMNPDETVEVPKVVLLNLSLCSGEEKALLAPLLQRS